MLVSLAVLKAVVKDKDILSTIANLSSDRSSLREEISSDAHRFYKNLLVEINAVDAKYRDVELDVIERRKEFYGRLSATRVLKSQTDYTDEVKDLILGESEEYRRSIKSHWHD